VEACVEAFGALPVRLFMLPWLFHTFPCADLALSREALASIVLPPEAKDFMEESEGEATDLWGRGREDFLLEVSTSEDEV